MIFKIPKFHFRFKDRRSAGKLLAIAVKDILKNIKSNINNSNVTILGIPRGGVVVADILASKLSIVCHFGFVIPRKLGAPHNSEVAIGAIMEDGTTYIHEVAKSLELSEAYLDKEKSEQLDEIKRRQKLYLTHNTYEFDGTSNNEIQNKIVVLVDDGAATGSTLIVAARWIRKKSPKSLIIAVPIAPKETVILLKKEADVVEVITSPSSEEFRSVGQFYRTFSPVSDIEVQSILQKRKLQLQS